MITVHNTWIKNYSVLGIPQKVLNKMELRLFLVTLCYKQHKVNPLLKEIDWEMG
jgi:hypothetical protein